MEDVSTDLLTNIFERLEIRSLASCHLVCRAWAAVIESQEFTRRFRARPGNQARLVLGFTWESCKFDYLDPRFRNISSSSPYQSPYSESIDHSFESRHSGCPLLEYDCVEGLISHGTTIMNPGFGWEIDLPLIDPDNSEEQRLLGFDPVSGQYKLLALRVEKRSGLGDFQVLTLRKDSKEWRVVNSTTPDMPKTKSVCIDGMVYYFALTDGTYSLVRFNVATEALNFFQVADGSSSSLVQHFDRPKSMINGNA